MSRERIMLTQAIPAVQQLRRVQGFDPLRFLKRNANGGIELEPRYQRLWFRLACPDGKMLLNRLRITDQIAVYILHIIVKFKVIILPVPAVHFAEKCLSPILWCQVWRVDHRAAPKRVEVRLFHFQPDLRVRLSHRMGKYTLALGHLHFLFLQKADAGDPCAAHIIKDIGTAQVPLLLANDADRILAAAANTLLHIVFDFNTAAFIAIAAYHTGTVDPAGDLRVLPVLSLASLRFHLLGALFVGIALTGGMAGTERDWEAADAVWTVLAFIGAAQQRVVIFRTVIDALKRSIAAGKAAAERAFPCDQKTAGRFPYELQKSLKEIAEILPVAPVHEGGVILPRIAGSIEIPGQLILAHVYIPGHGTSPKWFSIT